MCANMPLSLCLCVYVLPCLHCKPCVQTCFVFEDVCIQGFLCTDQVLGVFVRVCVYSHVFVCGFSVCVGFTLP